MGVFIIAEVGPNHNGNLKMALEYIERLSEIGVDAIKFQLSIPENLHSIDSMKARYQMLTDETKDPLSMSRKLNLSFDEHIKLKQKCDQLGTEYLCTAFDIESLHFLNEQLDVQRYKIPSGEIFSLDILDYIRRQQKPIILSTGMATYDEIRWSLEYIDYKKQNITILHCISNYPAPLDDVNLRCMVELRRRFGCFVGFSDHTIGNDSAIAAVALGASIIEKHVTLDKNLPGPDHKASASIGEFASLVKSIRNAERCLGTDEKIFSDDEKEITMVARKSIVSKRNLFSGQIFKEEDIFYKRPGTGYLPFDQEKLIGRKLARNVEKNRVLKKEDFIW
jgi:N,N'-diacetyllegionaminate synthase